MRAGACIHVHSGVARYKVGGYLKWELCDGSSLKQVKTAMSGIYLQCCQRLLLGHQFWLISIIMQIRNNNIRIFLAFYSNKVLRIWGMFLRIYCKNGEHMLSIIIRLSVL